MAYFCGSMVSMATVVIASLVLSVGKWGDINTADDNDVSVCLIRWLQAPRMMVWVYWRLAAVTVVWITPGFHYQEIDSAKAL